MGWQSAKKVRAVLATALLLVSCGRKPNGSTNLFPDGSPMAPVIRFQYAVYCLPKHTKDPFLALRKILARDLSRAELVDKLPENPQRMFVRAHLETNVPKSYAPLDFDEVAKFGHGLSKKQNMQFQRSQEAFILDFAHPSRDVWRGLRSANQVVEELAREMNGFVWDEETRRVYTPDAWRNEVIASWTGAVPNVSDLTRIDEYQKGEFVREVTLGMKKFGLPDVTVPELDTSSEKSVGSLIDLFTQSLVEGRTIPKSGRYRLDLHAIQNLALRDSQLRSLKSNAAGVACVTPKNGVRDEGDADNRLLSLYFEEYPGPDSHAQLQGALDGLFGWEDSIQYINHTEEVLEASRKARAELPRLRADFAAGLKPGEYILVKSPFEIPGGGNEWMWVEIRAWHGNDIEGLLENTPENVPNLTAGQLVKVREDQVFDYSRHLADGNEEGNTTAKFINPDGNENKSAPKSSNRSFVPKCKE